MTVSVCIPSLGLEPDAQVITTALAQMPTLHQIVVAQATEPFDYWHNDTHVQGLVEPDPVLGPSHAGNLHVALRAATGDHILFTDDDTAFLTDVASLYWRLMQAYGLLVIGAGHFVPTDQCYGNFPCVISLMMRTADLPPDDYLKGLLRTWNSVRRRDPRGPMAGEIAADGRWLVQCPVEEYAALYPDPEGCFDVGHNLWLWCHQHSGRWLSFLPQAEQNYDTAHYESNCGVTLWGPATGLIWHRVSHRHRVG